LEADATVTVWDAEGTPAHAAGLIVLWRGFATAGAANTVSMPALVEARGDHFRTRYLGWLYDLGEAQIAGRRLRDHFQLRPTFSLWWMTHLAHKFNASGASPIHDAIKLLALEEYLTGNPATAVELFSANSALAKSLARLCGTTGKAFRWRRVGPAAPPDVKARLRHLLPMVVQAVIHLVRYVARRSLRGRPAMCAADATLTFVDVLVHLDPQTVASGRFVSNYWTGLVGEVARSGMRTSWLHSYFTHHAVPSFAAAQQLVARLNEAENSLQCHRLIDSHLCVPVIARALRDYFSVLRAAARAREIRRRMRPAGSAVDLWPLFEREWRDCARGQGAMANCLLLNLFERAVGSLPRQAMGVYLQENQPWEMALVHAWKSAGHGRLIGVPHTTVRFWDLRYFYDPRTYASRDAGAMPRPDQVAVNGPVALRAYREAGYPDEELRVVEALRYMHLLKRPAPRGRAPGDPLRVLVCGDFHHGTNRKLLSWIDSAAKSLPAGTTYCLKPHPAYPFRRADLPGISARIANEPLAELLGCADVVFTSNITSSAVDAYCAGVPVVQMLDGDFFNMSPLRGLPGVTYVTGPAELVGALREPFPCDLFEPEQYFNLNRELPLWRQLLCMAVSAS
jgi:surface carbohydrate biosynthesis protein (TIGR04326 family)